MRHRGRALEYAERDRIPTTLEILGAHGLDVTARSGDTHYIVSTPRGNVDFWPGTGLWHPRGTAETSRGLFALIAWAKVPVEVKS